MRAFQNPLVGPVLRKLVNPQDILGCALVGQAHDALPSGGAMIVYDA